MSWTKFNPGKEKPASKNAHAITKEGRAQKLECLNGRKGQEGDLKSEILVVGQKNPFPLCLVHGFEWGFTTSKRKKNN